MAQKITPFLWFDNNAEQAIEFYLSLFDDSKILAVTRYGTEGPGEPGGVMTITFQLAGQEFIALNGGPVFQFSQAISLFVHCQSQVEVDRLWERLSDGGQEQMCGWLIDRFGVTWQIVPDALFELINDPDPQKAARATRAMLQMRKIDIAALQRAHSGG